PARARSSRASAALSFLHRPGPCPLCPLALHDALPILLRSLLLPSSPSSGGPAAVVQLALPFTRASFLGNSRHASREASSHAGSGDRKSTRLNSSHVKISYAVFCLKKKRAKEQAPSPYM